MFLFLFFSVRDVGEEVSQVPSVSGIRCRLLQAMQFSIVLQKTWEYFLFLSFVPLCLFPQVIGSVSTCLHKFERQDLRKAVQWACLV